MDLSVHRHARGGSRRTKGGPGPLPPHPGGHDAAVPRRLSSAALPPPLAPPGLCPEDWDTVTAGHGGPVSHEAGRLTSLGREEKELPFNSYDLFSLYNVKPVRLYKCANWQNIIIILANPVLSTWYYFLSSSPDNVVHNCNCSY